VPRFAIDALHTVLVGHGRLLPTILRIVAQANPARLIAGAGGVELVARYGSLFSKLPPTFFVASTGKLLRAAELASFFELVLFCMGELFAQTKTDVKSFRKNLALFPRQAISLRVYSRRMGRKHLLTKRQRQAIYRARNRAGVRPSLQSLAVKYHATIWTIHRAANERKP